MKDYRQTLRKAGQILIVVGAIDVAFMVVCILTSQIYASTVHVFAIAVGIYLKRGNLHTALWAARFGALIIAACTLGVVFVLPSFQPTSLWLTELRLRPWTTLPMVAPSVLILPPLVWIYVLLRRPEVRNALEENGLTVRPPILWFAIGIGFASLLAMAMDLMFHGDTAEKAIAAARAQNGDRYKYAVRQMFVNQSGGSAVVTAYKHDEIKDVSVNWQSPTQ